MPAIASADPSANTKIIWLATLGYAAVVVALAFFHEPWRDEVRALNIAAHSHSPAELLRNLKNEGHPALWYVLLSLGHGLTGAMWVLKPIALLVAIAAVHLLFRYGPFPWWQKGLFVVGQLPLYEYSVMCRNYGISMLLIFAGATVYRHRFTRPACLAVVLALLANTNVHSAVVVAAWLLAWIGDWIAQPRREGAGPQAMGLAVGIVVAGLACCLWVVYPDNTSIVVNTQAHTRASVWRALVDASHGHGEIHGSMTGVSSALAVDLLFWLFAASFLTRPWLAAAVAMAGVGLATFPRLVYPLALRHSGVLMLFCVAAMWMAADAPADRLRFTLLDRFVRGLERQRWAALSLFLLLQATLGVVLIGTDLRGSLSGTAALGRKLCSEAGLRQAIVIPEPEPQIEALPYHCDNPIYLARERGYLVKVNFTTANAQVTTLDELLATGEDLHRTTGRPVVFALGHGLDENGPFERVTPFGKVFRYTVEGWRTFVARTVSLGFVGGDSGDENFFVYQLKDSVPARAVAVKPDS